MSKEGLREDFLTTVEQSSNMDASPWRQSPELTCRL